jgi:hypothetical protein
MKRGAKMAHTIRCRRIRLTEMQELNVSNSWKKQYVFHKNDRPVKWDVVDTAIKPTISQPNVFKKRDPPPLIK